ncbi:MAG: hypothetical protein ABIJ45_12070 [Candidatus Zixiibacteriota bacterium]
MKLGMMKKYSLSAVGVGLKPTRGWVAVYFIGACKTPTFDAKPLQQYAFLIKQSQFAVTV